MTTTRIFEAHDASFGGYYEATEVLDAVRSEFQDISVIETALHGRVMLIDGLTMLTDHTHHVYHEMMTHTPLACVKEPRSVLVIGGGDGGCVTELVKRPDLERIVLAELDGAVIEVARKWFPSLTKGLDDPRVEIRVGDGAAYLADQENAFDLVIIDSTDVCDEAVDSEVASPLATDAFYASLKRALRPGGVAAQVLGSPVFYRDSLARLLHRLDGLWPHFKPMLVAYPFYITGDWACGLMSVDAPLNPTDFPLPANNLRYANAAVAAGALALPNEVRTMLETGEARPLTSQAQP